MQNREFHILPTLPPAEPPVDLFARILRTVERLRMQRLLRRLAFVATGCVSAVAFVAWEWSAFWTEVAYSAFGEYLKLAISDPDVMLPYAKNLVFGLLESLPMNALLALFINALLLLCGVALIQSIRELRRDMNRPLILN